MQTTTPPTIKTSFLILSDTHGHPPSALPSTPLHNPAALAADVLLHCGDLTSTGAWAEHQHTFALLAAVRADLKLVLPGNHDLPLDPAFWRAHNGSTSARQRVLDLWTGPAALQAGIRLLAEGVHTFTLSSGAQLRLYASPYTPIPVPAPASAFQYPSAHDRFNSAADAAPEAHYVSGAVPVPPFPRVDIVMTHGPPKYRLDLVRGENLGCAHLMRAVARARPVLHCFGHVHGGYGGEVCFWKDGGDTHGREGGEAWRGEDFGIGEHVVRVWRGRNAVRRKGVARLDLTGEGAGMGLQKGNATCFINASVLDEEDELSNFPWLVQLDLRDGRVGVEGLEGG